MEPPRSIRYIPSHETLKDSISDRSQLNLGHITSIKNHSQHSKGRSKENRTPGLLPSTLSGMLKTTTETGEIDLFIAKKRFNSPRKTCIDYVEDESPLRAPQHSRYPSGALLDSSGIDDRRFLPSYARDTTSEIVSMYETASQKASYTRRYEDSDLRTYSMNQSFRSSNTLSNHRSFASLQGECNLPQRPHSPFAYPTRLKRPGFRPSSPALTDGGGIDYARRAELERSGTVSLRHRTSHPHRSIGRGPRYSC
jgi:hypothetical protein